MGRDIRVESKTMRYYGGKSDDLNTLFCLYQSNKTHIPWDFCQSYKFSRKQMKDVKNYMEELQASNPNVFHHYEDLKERIDNLFIRLMPNEFVEIAFS